MHSSLFLPSLLNLHFFPCDSLFSFSINHFFSIVLSTDFQTVYSSSSTYSGSFSLHWDVFRTSVKYTFDDCGDVEAINRMHSWTLEMFSEHPLGDALKVPQTLDQILRRGNVLESSAISAPSLTVSRTPIADSLHRSPAVSDKVGAAVSTGGWMSNALRYAFYGPADVSRSQSAPVGRGNERETAKEKEGEKEVVESASVGVGSGLAVQDTLLRSDRVDVLCMIAGALLHDPPTIGYSLTILIWMLLADSSSSVALIYLCITHCSCVTLFASSHHLETSSHHHRNSSHLQLTSSHI